MKKQLVPAFLLALPLLAACGGTEVEPYPSEAERLAAYDVGSAEQPLTACGTILTSWNGTNVYSNGSNTGTGYSCAGLGTYGYQYQCVELVMRHFKTKWGLSWYGNAHDLLANAPTAYVDVYYNGGAVGPVPGDMITFDKSGDPYGHVALVTAVTSTSVSIVEQNVSTSYARTLSRSGNTINSGWTGWYVQGWAHAKANTGSSGGTGWNCANSSYNGAQYWTCNSAYTSRNKCDGAGTPQTESCQRGCFSNSLGKDDLCIFPASSWSCANSAYNGQQWWTCSGGYLYKCDSQGGVVAYCPAGCNVGALGTNDTCK